MSDVTDLLASIDDVLKTVPPVSVPAPVPAASAAPVEPVERTRRSTVTDIPYEPVSPAITRRLHSAATARQSQPQPLSTPASVAADVEPVEASTPPKSVAPVEAPAAPEPADGAAEPSGTAGKRARLRRTKRQAAAPTAVDVPGADSRLRWLAVNASAAGAGHLAVWSLTGDPMAGADLMARMTLSVPQLAAAGLTIGAAYGGWRVGGLLKGLPGAFGLAARPVGAVLAGLWGQGTAPLVRDVLDAVEPWGTLLSPLLAVGPLAAACWYGLDRRAAAAQLIPPVRWVLRIPLATVVVSSLLYAPGALL